MDDSQIHYAKWKKTYSKDYIQCHFFGFIEKGKPERANQSVVLLGYRRSTLKGHEDTLWRFGHVLDLHSWVDHMVACFCQKAQNDVLKRGECYTISQNSAPWWLFCNLHFSPLCPESAKTVSVLGCDSCCNPQLWQTVTPVFLLLTWFASDLEDMLSQTLCHSYSLTLLRPSWNSPSWNSLSEIQRRDPQLHRRWLSVSGFSMILLRCVD